MSREGTRGVRLVPAWRWHSTEGTQADGGKKELPTPLAPLFLPYVLLQIRRAADARLEG